MKLDSRIFFAIMRRGVYPSQEVTVGDLIFAAIPVLVIFPRLCDRSR